MIKITIEKVKEFALYKNGVCLSNVYINRNAKLAWQCNKGHIWKSSWADIKGRKLWCPKCARISRRLTIEEMRKIADSNNGACLSDKYVNNCTKLTWKCNACGNVWESSPASIKSGTWCPRCAGAEKKSIEYAKKLAIDRHGKCLSEIYIDVHGKLRWECNVCGKIWEASLNNIQRGTWCPRCSHRESATIDDMKKLAQSRKGKCLSRKYKGIDTKLIWKCDKCGNVWKATPYNVRRVTWCPQCAGVKKGSIEEMKELAKSRNGECLSNEYINCGLNLLWKCNDCNRTWEATSSNVKRGTWCPYCHHKSEDLCRKIFEDIFKDKFPKSRPSWLRNSKTNRKMELDGFNKRLKIAFEYNGFQHYLRSKTFHKSEIEFKEGVERDKLKKKLCEERNIILIIIPQINLKYKGFIVTKNNLKDFILKSVKISGRIPELV